MELIDHMLDALPEEPIPVRKVIVGVHWTLVCSKHCGLGSTMINQGPHGHSQVRAVGALHQKNAQELASWIRSENLLEASIGIAAINSLLDVDETKLEKVNASEVIARHCSNKNLVVVGHFPFVERMHKLAQNCWVIEKRPFGDDFPEDAAREFIPQADVVAITGTALINHTMQGLLSLCRPGALVMVLGPSTPLMPLLFDYGIAFLSGARVYDEAAAEMTIQQGATFQQVEGVRLLTMTQGDLI